MATEADPGAILNQKFVLLEQRIAQLELQLQNSSKELLSLAPNGIAPATQNPASTTTERPGDNGASPQSASAANEGSSLVSAAISVTAQPSLDGVEVDSKPNKASRIRTVIRQWDEEVKEWRDVPQPKKKDSDKDNDSESVARAFTFRKKFNSDGRTLSTEEIEIEDTKLYEALKKAFCNVYSASYFTAWPTDNYTIDSPFQELVYCYDELDRASVVQDEDDEATRAHKEDIQLLLEAVKTSSDLEPYFKSRSETPNTISFRYLWALFPPGTEVVSRLFFNHWQLFRVDWEPEPFSEDDDNQPSWGFDAWCYDWDAKHNGQYVRVKHLFKFSKFVGQREIGQLSCYPLKYFKDNSTSQEKDRPDTLKQKLLETGELFKTFCNYKGAQRLFEYDDLAIIMGKSRANALLKDDETRYRSIFEVRTSAPADEGGKRVKAVKGRAIVDAEAYLDRGSGSLHIGDSQPTEVCEPDMELRDDRVPTNPDGDWARFCPPRILGYSLDLKQMLQFKVSRATTISPRRSKKPFEKELQLKKDQKDMLLALVDQHESHDKPNIVEDIVEGKGRSLVILLHGPPGVGKTLTAETLAKATGKPLIVVSVAEIGLRADQAESKLERLFGYAARWEAILLVDEADVFLEARSSDAGTERNALVSVLLRVLEYYTGTIILTTNRISSLDVAVQSRIHLSIRYDDLSRGDCQEIFKHFIAEAEFEDGKKEEVLEWFVEEVSEEKLNGRQIRNLVTSAQAFAKSKKEALNRQSFKKIFKVTQDFQKQLMEQTMRARALNEVGSGRGGT